MTITVIIPTLNEAGAIGPTLSETARLGFDRIIVVDGGSTDGTCAIVDSIMAQAPKPARGRADYPALLDDCPITLLSSSKGRARQLNEGAAAADTDILLFLHADTRLPDGARQIVAATMAGNYVGGRFDVRFDDDSFLAQTVARFMNLRSRLTGIATGDQAIFVRRLTFEAIGRYADIPLMEDIEFSRRLKQAGEVAALRAQVVTAYRRWRVQGPLRTILLMWTLRFLYWLGVSASRLDKMYRAVR
jgi:rSAM/selenodomain-associated transferase 2